MKVLSLFDGIATGYEALLKAGIKVDKYYASEIDKSAIKIALKNHPDIVEIGDVTQIDFNDYKDVDLVLGGFCCQSWSMSGKQKGFNDPRGQLFFNLLEALKIIKPKYFLLENVKMKQEFKDKLSEYLGCEPIEIDSALVSAQRRKRLYWTNIPGVQQPEDKGIMLKDIVHEYEEGFAGDLEKYKIPIDKSLKICDEEIKKRKIAYFGTDSQGNRVYSIHDKSVTLCGQAGGKGAKTGLYLFGCITPDRVNKRQNGQRFNDGEKSYTLTAQDQHGVLIDGYIRKLTPVECERLQCLPDGYTEGVSDNQRIKALGNGWTADVIVHILKYLAERRTDG